MMEVAGFKLQIARHVVSTFASRLPSAVRSIPVRMGFSPSLLAMFLLLAGTPVMQAQLSLTNDLHPEVLPLNTPVLGAAAGAEEAFKGNAFNPATTAVARTPEPFDFTKTAPHLAFFCRLEINEAKGGVIPAKFRLGGHRYWQDGLSKRD